MADRKRVFSLARVISSLFLAGCGGGNGGTMSVNLPSPGVSSQSPVSLDIDQPGAFSAGSTPVVPATAGNFSTPPSSPITFRYNGLTANLSNTFFKTVDFADAPSVTWTGNRPDNGVMTQYFEIKVPDLNIDVEIPNETGGGFENNGNGPVGLGFGSLHYTMVGDWEVLASNNLQPPTYVGIGVAGFQTAPTDVPTNGTATYGSPSNGFGLIYLPSADANSVQKVVITGTVGVNVNFGTGAVTGGLTNMRSAVAGTGFAPATMAPWNDVILSGSINANDASLSGATSVGSASGPFAFSAAAKGQFRGNFYGPTGQEIGLGWTLYDPPAAGAPSGNGRVAIGVLSATKQ